MSLFTWLVKRLNLQTKPRTTPKPEPIPTEGNPEPSGSGDQGNKAKPEPTNGRIVFAGDFMPDQAFENDFCILNRAKRGVRTMTDPMRLAAIQYLVTSGYTMAHVCPVIDGLGAIPDLAFMRKWIGEFKLRGLQVCLWLGKGNSDEEGRQSEADYITRARGLARSVGDLVDVVCLGIEIDEYHWDAARVGRMAAAVREAFGLPVAIHTAGRNRVDYFRHADVAFVQYGFATSPGDAESFTRALLAQLAVPVVAMEYHRQGRSAAAHAIAAGAMRGGAIGFGNGGDAAAIALARGRGLAWKRRASGNNGGAVETVQLPADAVDVSNFICIGIEHANFNPSKAKRAWLLRGATISKNRIALDYSVPVWATHAVGVCMGWRDAKTGDLVGGFADWCEDRHSIDLHNVVPKPGIFSKVSKYARTPTVGADVFVWIGTPDERTNVVKCAGTWQG